MTRTNPLLLSAWVLALSANAYGCHRAEVTPTLKAPPVIVPIAPAVVATVVPVAPDPMAAWIGDYTYEESAPGYAWGWSVKVRREGGSVVAHVAVDGWQTETRLLCAPRIDGQGRLGIYFVDYDPENILTKFDPDDHLFSLERKDGGVAYVWDKMQPNISTAPPPPRPPHLADIGSLDGKYPADFMYVADIDRRLHVMLGDRYEDFQNDISTQSPMVREGALWVMSGGYPHTGGQLSATLDYDTKTDLLHGYISDQLDKKQVDAFSEDWNRAPASFDASLRRAAAGRPIVRHAPSVPSPKKKP